MKSTYREFRKSIEFLKKQGFEIINYPVELLFQNFRIDTEIDHSQKLEEFEEREIRWKVFDYLGRTTSHRLNQEGEKYLCRQIWNFFPYLQEVHDEPPFTFIIERLEEIINAKIVIEEIVYQNQENHGVEFSFYNQRIKLTEESLFGLGIEFVFEIARLTQEHDQLENLFVINRDPAIVFNCKNTDLRIIMEYFEILKDQIQ